MSVTRFTLMFMNGVLTALAFSGVLWTISPLLFGVAIGYAALGTLAAVFLGRLLIGLNYRQSNREPSFRSHLIHARENAESMALDCSSRTVGEPLSFSAPAGEKTYGKYVSTS